MLDWKILAAGFVALLFVSSVVVGNFGLTDFVTQIVDGIQNIFGPGSFSGLAIATVGSKEVDLTLNPLSMTVKLDQPVDVTAGTTVLNNFQGEMELNFVDNVVTFKEGNSKLKVSVPAQKASIERLALKKVSTSGIKFLIKPNIFSSNGSLELTDFSGRADIDVGSLRLTGNVTKALVTMDGNTWGLV